MKKLFVILLSSVMLMSCIVPSFAEEISYEYAEESIGNFYEDFRAKSEYTKFAEDRVLVIMKHEYSGINKEFTAEDFPEIGIESVEDLTRQPEGTTPSDLFRQVLCLKLTNKSRAGVEEAIKALEQRAEKDIYFAQPEYMYDVAPDVENSKTSVKDAMNIVQYVVGTRELDTSELAKYDINADGKVNVKDAAQILRKIANS